MSRIVFHFDAIALAGDSRLGHAQLRNRRDEDRLLPHQQNRIGGFRDALPSVDVVFLETPRLPARREQDQFALVHAP